MRNRLGVLIFVVLTSAAPALAQNGSSFSKLQGPLPAAAPYSSPHQPCDSFTSLTDFDLTVLTAVAVESSSEAPEHCRITGLIPAEILFELNLPSAWNGRLYMYGNGGYAGNSPESPGKQRSRDRALRQGFATVYTNTGHDREREPGGSFAQDVAKTVDYAFRAVHLSVLAAKRIAADYYGGPVVYSYWDGCSTGGRQGLMSAQRFPDDFDGIIAGAPVLDFSGTMMSYIWKSRALRGAGLTEAKMDLVAERVYAKCDSRDGLEDGLISDPLGCFFDPRFELPICLGAERDDCLTTRQIEALEAIYSDVTADGERLYPAQPMSAEIATEEGRRGWSGWILNDEGPSTGERFSEEFIRYLAFDEDDPNRTTRSVDLADYREETRKIRSILDAVDPELGGFERAGGKMIMHFGWADTALNPVRAIDYYEAAIEANGAETDDFFRFYLVPGMFHCRGGVGADRFDLMTPLIDWVEKGEAPDSLIAERVEDEEVAFTRPLCPYPQIPVYQGEGDPDKASSFACEDSPYLDR